MKEDYKEIFRKDIKKGNEMFIWKSKYSFTKSIIDCEYNKNKINDFTYSQKLVHFDGNAKKNMPIYRSDVKTALIYGFFFQKLLTLCE